MQFLGRSVRDARAALAAGATWGAIAVAMAGAGGCAGESLSRDALDASATKADISRYAGREPDRCVYAGPDLELCAWRVERADPGWAALAEPLDVVADLNLLCELPIDGSPRAADSCGAYPRAGGALPAVSAGVVPAAALREALTLRALAAVLGDAPDRCRTGLGVQTCEWSVETAEPGYPVVASLAAEPAAGPLRLACELPLDGSARAGDSCQVSALN